MITKTGQCLCGAVKFEAELKDATFGACHCGMCRRWTGGPMHAKDAEKLTVTAGQEALNSYNSSDWADRVSCGTCGSSLWYHLKKPEMFIVAVGTFDDQSDMVMASEIFIDHKPGGYAFAGDLKQMTEAEVMAAFAPPEGAR